MATRTITVDFSVANVESVDAAIGGFTRKLEAAQQRGTARRRGTPDGDEEAGAKRLAAFREREAVRLESKLTLLREKASQQQAAREERAGMARLSKEERAKIASERKLAKEIEREQKKAAREVEKERIAGERRVAREQKAAARELAREQKASERERVALSRRVAGVTRHGLNAPFGLAAGAGRMATGIIAGGLALGGSAGIYDSLRAGIDAERRAIALVNSTDGAVTKDQLMSRSGAIARETGFSQTEAIGGVAQFVSKTGDIDTAMRNWENFAKIARATDSEIGDIADAAADLSSKFDIKSVEDMKQAFAGLVQQGKEGAFELKDMAEQFPRIGAAARNFGWSGTRGLSQLGGLAQIARQSTPGSEEAATSVENFFNQLQVKNVDLERGKFGRRFSIYNKAGDQRSGVKDLEELAPELIDSVGGNTGKLLKILDIRGMRAIASLNSIYNDTIGKTQGTDTEKRAAAMTAVREEITRRVDTRAANTMLDTDYARAQGGTGENIDRVIEDLRTEFGQKLLPVLQEAVPRFRELIPTLVDLTDKFVQTAPAIVDVVSKLGTLGLSFAKWATDNPLEAAIALVSAGIIKAVAVNAISSAVGSLIASAGLASVGLTGVSLATGPFLVALATLGLALYGVHKLISGSKYDDRRNGTVSDVHLGKYAKKYLDEHGDTPETRKALEKVKDEVQNARPEAYSEETKKFVGAYVNPDPFRQLQQTAGMDPLDELDREKIIDGIEGAQKAREAFNPKRPERAQLTELEALSMGIDPATLGIESTIFAPEPDLSGVYRRDFANETGALSLQDVVGDWRRREPAPEMNPFLEPEPETFQTRTAAARREDESRITESASKFAEVAPVLKAAADDLRTAARAARDGFQPNRTFK
jgi:TP901 family phage tail tape measure protein